MKKLTTAEEKIMKMFWDYGPSIVSGLIEKMPDPKPPHSSVSTIVRILERKGFLSHKAYGRTYEYYPVIQKEEYTKMTLKEILSGYFGNSPKSLVSFLVQEEKADIKELTELLQELEKKEK